MENKHCRRSIRMERFTVVDKKLGCGCVGHGLGFT